MNHDTPAVIFGGVFALLGAALTVYGIKLIAEAKASFSWPSVKGHITNSMVTSYVVRGGTRFMYKIEYEYTFAEIKQWSNVVSFGLQGSSSRLNSKELAEGYVAKYPIGKAVDVFCNPKNIQEAVLEPGTNVWNYVLVLGGLAFFICGILAIRG